MNKRQKAKHFKRLYEELKGRNSVFVKHEICPYRVVTYRAKTTIDLPLYNMIEDKDIVIKRKLVQQFEDAIKNNMDIYENFDEDMGHFVYTADLKIAVPG